MMSTRKSPLLEGFQPGQSERFASERALRSFTAAGMFALTALPAVDTGNHTLRGQTARRSQTQPIWQEPSILLCTC
jgi:hypothetical protein